MISRITGKSQKSLKVFLVEDFKYLYFNAAALPCGDKLVNIFHLLICCFISTLIYIVILGSYIAIPDLITN